MARILSEEMHSMLYQGIRLEPQQRDSVSIGLYGFGNIASEALKSLLSNRTLGATLVEEISIFTSRPEHNATVLKKEFAPAYDIDGVKVMPIDETYKHVHKTGIMLITGCRHSHSMPREEMTLHNYAMIKEFCRHVQRTGQPYMNTLAIVSNMPDMLCLAAANELNFERKFCDERRIIGVTDVDRLRAINEVTLEIEAKKRKSHEGERAPNPEGTIAIGPHGSNVIIPPGREYFSLEDTLRMEKAVEMTGPELAGIGENTLLSTSSAVMRTIRAICNEKSVVTAATLFPVKRGNGEKVLIYTGMPVQFFGGRAVIHQESADRCNENAVHRLEERIRQAYKRQIEKTGDTFRMYPIRMEEFLANANDTKEPADTKKRRREFRKDLKEEKNPFESLKGYASERMPAASSYAAKAKKTAITAGAIAVTLAAAYFGAPYAYHRYDDYKVSRLIEHSQDEAKKIQEFIDVGDTARASMRSAELEERLKGETNPELAEIYKKTGELRKNAAGKFEARLNAVQAQPLQKAKVPDTSYDEAKQSQHEAKAYQGKKERQEKIGLYLLAGLGIAMPFLLSLYQEANGKEDSITTTIAGNTIGGTLGYFSPLFLSLPYSHASMIVTGMIIGGLGSNVVNFFRD